MTGILDRNMRQALKITQGLFGRNILMIKSMALLSNLLRSPIGGKRLGVLMSPSVEPQRLYWLPLTNMEQSILSKNTTSRTNALLKSWKRLKAGIQGFGSLTPRRRSRTKETPLASYTPFTTNTAIAGSCHTPQRMTLTPELTGLASI